MSSVLEALKKAENERRDALAPSVLAAQQTAPRKQLRPQGDWRWVLWAGLIICNIGLVAWLLTTRPSTTSEVETSTAENRPAMQSPEQATEAELSTTANDNNSQQEDEAALVTQDMSEETQTEDFQLPVSGTLTEPRLASLSSDVAPLPIEAEVASAEPNPTPEPPATEKPDASYEGKDFDAMKLGAHIYSDTPSRRMIMLDSVAYRQGSQLANGWELIEIGREDLVVKKGGESYLLPLIKLR